MKLYNQTEQYKLYNGNMLDMLQVIEPNSIDAIVCDPPYELNFMNKGWDNTGIAFNVEAWKKCYEVLKPGGYLLAFGGSRTFHRIACAIEDAGFEIRDTLMWLYGNGFPKSHSIETDNNNWEGWGTSLKPAYEPIIMARKPLEDTIAKNCIKYGVGAINIEECRIDNGRFPANVLHDGSDEAIQNMPQTKGSPTKELGSFGFCFGNKRDSKPMAQGYNDKGSAARYFYCAKANSKDRNEGLDNIIYYELLDNIDENIRKDIERLLNLPN